MITEPFVFSGEVKNCFDSHVHWPSTGHWARRLSLQSLTAIEDLKNIVIKPEYFHGDWLLGYGWDQERFLDQQFPTRHILDELFPENFVCFTRVDGHAIWVNTKTLKLAGLWQQSETELLPTGGRVVRDDQGWPTGVLIDGAVRAVKNNMPAETENDLRQDLLAGQKIFHKAGFTHIRDLTCDLAQWNVARALEKSGELKLAVEVFFGAYDPARYQQVMKECAHAKNESAKLLRVKGLKVFYDGALGSEGALLSEPYKNCRHMHYGLRLIEPNLMQEILSHCFSENLELAVHVIGDQAAQEVVAVASELKKQNRLGPFHLEHAQLLRPETLELMKSLPVTCHFQPSHWLSDKKWLPKKLGALMNCAFRWRDVGQLGLAHFFGSDSPIETSSFSRTGEAIQDAALYDIPKPLRPWHVYHSHPDNLWVPNSVTVFKDNHPLEVIFAGEKILSNNS